MAYIPNEWKDQIVQRPKTYQMNTNDDGSVTLIDSFGLVTELGTPVNEDYMNHIEQGIAGVAIRYYNKTETYTLNEWVLGEVNDEKGIYQSLIADNTGNALTDTTKWKKLELGGAEWGSISGDISEQTDLQQALTAKLNSDFSNSQKPYITETYQNGDSWYCVRSDGWIEQGNTYWKNSSCEGLNTINFIKPFSNTNYTFSTNCLHIDSGLGYGGIAEIYPSRTTSQTKIKLTSALFGYTWRACGY